MRAARHRPDVIHVVPDGLAISALAAPFIETAGTGYSAAGSMANAITGGGGVSRSQSAQDAVYNLVGNFKASVIPMIELGALAYGSKWVGRKFGLNKIGSKKVKLL